MGFNSVYRALQELFPQVDVRILKAVAIENAKDIDVAAETIVTDVLPFIPEKINAHSSMDENCAHNSSVADERHLPVKMVCPNDGNSSEHGSIFADNEAKGSDESRESQCAAPALLNGTIRDSLDLDGPKDLPINTKLNDPEVGHDKPFYDASDLPITTELNEGDTIADPWKYYELHGYMNIDSTACASTSTSTAPVQVPDEDLMHAKNRNLGSDTHPLLLTLNPDIPAPPTSDGGFELQNILDRKLLNSYDHLPVDDQSCEPLLSLQSEDEKENDTSNSLLSLQSEDEKENDTSNSESTVDSCSNQDDSPVMDSVVSQSGQICSIDLLENIIDEAKSHKERLSSAIESVTKLIWEVELAEKEAEESKQDAAKGGVDIYAGANELKTMLKHAKEANDMHSGEVYGERAILATEVRELQNRLLGLSVERDESLSMLDEMQQTLEARKAVAEHEKIAAEEVKVQKEKGARLILDELDSAMKKVVEESRMLDQEAEENEKLREFLVDRGHVVDALQGEISVICQDVKLLKEKFDNRIPLSRSLTLGHTSCSLASSASSAKSNPSSTESVQSVSGQIESSEHPDTATMGQEEVSSEKRGAATDDKPLFDDDWELFEAAA